MVARGPPPNAAGRTQLDYSNNTETASSALFDISAVDSATAQTIQQSDELVAAVFAFHTGDCRWARPRC